MIAGFTSWPVTSTRSLRASVSISGSCRTRLRALVWMSGGRIRWRTIQIILNAGYVDGFRRLHPDDPGLTFPVWDPHVRLDYVFASAGQAERLLTCEVIRHPPPTEPSDHFPLLAEIA